MIFESYSSWCYTAFDEEDINVSSKNTACCCSRMCPKCTRVPQRTTALHTRLVTGAFCLFVRATGFLSTMFTSYFSSGEKGEGNV